MTIEALSAARARNKPVTSEEIRQWREERPFLTMSFVVVRCLPSDLAHIFWRQAT